MLAASQAGAVTGMTRKNYHGFGCNLDTPAIKFPNWWNGASIPNLAKTVPKKNAPTFSSKQKNAPTLMPRIGQVSNLFLGRSKQLEKHAALGLPSIHLAQVEGWPGDQDGLKNWVTHTPVVVIVVAPEKNYHKHNHHGKPIDFAWQFNAPATSAEMVQLKPTSLRLMPVASELLKSCAPNKMFHKKPGSCDICEPITTTSTTSYSLWPSNPATPSLL